MEREWWRERGGDGGVEWEGWREKWRGRSGDGGVRERGGDGGVEREEWREREGGEGGVEREGWREEWTGRSGEGRVRERGGEGGVEIGWEGGKEPKEEKREKGCFSLTITRCGPEANQQSPHTCGFVG